MSARSRLRIAAALLVAFTGCTAAPWALAASASTAASAPTPTDHAAIRQTIRDINPNAVIRSIDESPLPGMKRVVADSTVVYTTDDGRYLMYGVLIDTVSKRNLTDEALGDARKQTLDTIPEADKIVYSPKDPKYTVTIFTDTSCHFCQMLHKNIKAYMDAGIRVEYVPWPREGQQSAEMIKMQSVWCSKDRQKAFDTAITGGVIAPTNCARSGEVAKLWELGDKLGIEGTPAIFDKTGRQLGGFIPPAQLISKLQGSDKAAARASGSVSQ
jgi:thiol:disulfide interchange protein DsbC